MIDRSPGEEFGAGGGEIGGRRAGNAGAVGGQGIRGGFGRTGHGIAKHRDAFGRDGLADIQIRPMGALAPFDLDRGRLDSPGIAIAGLGDAPRQRAEFHGLEEGDQLRAILRLQHQRIERQIQRRVGAQRHQRARQARQLGIGDDAFAALLLLDFGGAGQQRVEIAVFGQQLRRRLRADAGNAGNIVGGIAGQRLQVDHLLRRHAPFLDDVGNADLLVLHAVIHVDIVGDELHQVFIGRDDGDVAAGRFRLAGIGGDDVVGLETLDFDAGQVEGAGGGADQAELRHQILRRGRAVRLVGLVERLAEGLRRIVEDDGEMGGRDADRGVAGVGQQLPQHVAEAGDRADRQAVGFARQRRKRVEGAEDEARAVDEEKVIAVFHGLMDSAGCVQDPSSAPQFSVRKAAHRNVTDL